MTARTPHVPRVRKKAEPPTAEAVRPQTATEARVDRLLVSLKGRKEVVTEDLAACLAVHSVIVTPILHYLEALGWLCCRELRSEGKATQLWKLTIAGAREAVFAAHRARTTGMRTAFADGINPWTGAKVVQRSKNIVLCGTESS